MITHERLVETVATEARLDRTEEAAQVARTVLADLSLHLDMPRRRQLRQALPPAERDAAYAVVPSRTGGLPAFLQEIGEHLDAPPERAYHLARTVLSTLGAHDPELAAVIGRHLPPDVAELLAQPAGDAARRHPLTSAPARLDPQEVSTALGRRPAWSGDSRRLTRTVGLPSDRIRPLLHRVAQDTRHIEHSFDHRIADGEVTFTLYTRSVDGVTAADLRLADAIDATVNAFGSGG